MYDRENSALTDTPGQNGPELSANQTKALAALLTHTRIEDAAQASGLSARTMRRYLAEPEFSRAYREQQRILLSETTATLQRIATTAANVIEESMAADIEDKNLRLRAARTGLDFLLKATETERKLREIEDLEERIVSLESAQKMSERFGL